MLNIKDKDMVVQLKSQDIEKRLSLYQVFISGLTQLAQCDRETPVH